MASKAAETISQGLEFMAVVLPRRIGNSRRMVVLSAPGMKRVYGEPACENSDGRTVVYVSAMDVLAWLAAAELVDVRTKDGKPLLAEEPKP
jgi:hypothetical protein